MPTTAKGLPYPNANTDQPNGPLQIQQLAQAVDGALPGAWQTITQSNPNYLAVPATSWTTLTDYAGATITVPSGKTLNVQFDVPFVTVGALSTVMFRLKIGGAYPRSARLTTSGTDTQLSMPVLLIARVVGTGAGIPVSVEALRINTGEVKGDGVTGPALTYQIV